MAFPTVPTVAAGRVLTAVQADTSATRTFPSLSGLTKNAGDLLIAIVVCYQSSLTSNIFSGWGASFTEFHDSGGSSQMCIGIAYKRSDGTETGTFSVTQGGTVTGHAALILLSIPGSHSATAPEAGSRATGTTAAADPASFDPAGWGAEDTLWIALAGCGETSTSGTFTALASAPSSYGDYAETGISADAVGGVEAAVAFRQLNASAENVGTFSLDTSNARNVAVVIAIRPAPDPGIPDFIGPTGTVASPAAAAESTAGALGPTGAVPNPTLDASSVPGALGPTSTVYNPTGEETAPTESIPNFIGPTSSVPAPAAAAESTAAALGPTATTPAPAAAAETTPSALGPTAAVPAPELSAESTAGGLGPTATVPSAEAAAASTPGALGPLSVVFNPTGEESGVNEGVPNFIGPTASVFLPALAAESVAGTLGPTSAVPGPATAAESSPAALGPTGTVPAPSAAAASTPAALGPTGAVYAPTGESASPADSTPDFIGPTSSVPGPLLSAESRAAPLPSGAVVPSPAFSAESVPVPLVALSAVPAPTLEAASTAGPLSGLSAVYGPKASGASEPAFVAPTTTVPAPSLAAESEASALGPLSRVFPVPDEEGVPEFVGPTGAVLEPEGIRENFTRGIAARRSRPARRGARHPLR